MDTYRVHEIAQKYTEYDMIQAYTELPAYPESRTRLLFAFLNKGSTAKEHSELFALVTSLVQMGLDTHDMVEATHHPSETDGARSRQLKVLAGDYFSGRFYHLLSQAGQIEIVNVLSQAICDVNRLKMIFYEKIKQLKMSADEYIQHTVNIRTQLFLSFSKLMEGHYVAKWPELLLDFTKCEVIVQEIERSYTSDRFAGSWAYWHMLQTTGREELVTLDDRKDWPRIHSLLLKYQVKPKLLAMLDQQLHQLQQKINQCASDKLVRELQQLCQPFMRLVSAPKVLEEI